MVGVGFNECGASTQSFLVLNFQKLAKESRRVKKNLKNVKRQTSNKLPANTRRCFNVSKKKHHGVDNVIMMIGLQTLFQRPLINVLSTWL